jgi:hypothetical protein
MLYNLTGPATLYGTLMAWPWMGIAISVVSNEQHILFSYAYRWQSKFAYRLQRAKFSGSFAFCFVFDVFLCLDVLMINLIIFGDFIVHKKIIDLTSSWALLGGLIVQKCQS